MTRILLARTLTTCSVATVALVSACGVEKSENVLSPSVAGPIAGVEISAPNAVEPTQGTKVKHTQQPIRLMVQNASSNGARPLWYTFELASDSGFTSKLFAKTSIAPGQDGKTAVQIDRLDLGRTYYWRARAEDGANTGPYTTVQFEVLPQPMLGAPPLLSPINNQTTANRQPTLSVGTPERNSAVGAVTIEVQAATDQAFANLVYHEAGRETGGQNNFTPGHELPASAQIYWRARATDGESTSPWSVTQGFLTPAAPAPSPSPSPGGGGSCASSDGPTIVACIAAKYPDKLVAGISLSERQTNMAYLRDRIIDAGKCGGLDLGLNLKRGGPDISIDFLAWRRGDGDMGVDIGFSYDDTSVPLQLQWSEAGLGATYQATAQPNCSQQ